MIRVYVLSGVVCLLLAATATSVLPTDLWFVRAIDMAREPLMALAGIAALVAFGLPKWRVWIVLACALVVAINLWRVWPYTVLAPDEIDKVSIRVSNVPIDKDANCFVAYALNVKMKNRDFAPVLDQIRAADADVVLLMEPDARWSRALQPVLEGYPEIHRHPQDDAYGMSFATRLDIEGLSWRENTSRNTPTLYATLGLPNGKFVDFIGLHPKPPLPGQDTAKRDANIAKAGAAVAKGTPALVMGDFNDVPWSRTTTRLREEGDWMDPRIGRGSYPTFPASSVPLGWPLDQIMVKGGLRLMDFQVMPATSADHRAIRATLCLDR